MSGRPTTRVRFKGRFTSGWAFRYRRPRSARPASEQTVHVPGKRVLAPGKGSGCSATPILPPPSPSSGEIGNEAPEAKAGCSAGSEWYEGKGLYRRLQSMVL